MQKICLYCHTSFSTQKKHQIYCCHQCQKKGYKQIYYKRKINNDIDSNKLLIRQSYCAKCHTLVLIYNIKDRRTKFCSPHCEKLYWKHHNKCS